MKAHHKIAMICVSTLALSACGGGGSGGAGKIPAKPAMSYLEIAEISEDRDERIEDRYYAVPGTANEFHDKARTLNMPTSGTANYNGEAWMTIDEGVSVKYQGKVINEMPQVVGQGTLKADFGKKTLNGTITDFVPAPGHSSTGAKAAFNGKIDGNRVHGAWKGNVNFDNVNHEFANVKNVIRTPQDRIDSDGSFVGPDAVGLYVEGEGVTSRGNNIVVESFFEKNGKLEK